jgi:PDZ domain-containing protein
MHQGSYEASPVDPSLPQPPSRRRRVAAWVVSGVGVLLVAVLIAGFLIHLPYVVISPGAATPLNGLVHVEGAPTYEHQGDVRYLTVRVSGSDPNVWKVVTSWLDSDKEVVDRTSVSGCLSDAENVAFNARLMLQSQDDAKKVALERVGYQVTAETPEVLISDVRAQAGGCGGGPSSGVLFIGDQIVSIDGQPVTEASTIGPIIGAHEPGDVASVTVQRNGATEQHDVTTGVWTAKEHCVAVDSRAGADALRASSSPPPPEAATPETEASGLDVGDPCLGIAVQQSVRYTFPIEVNIDISRVGGPSAGLAFTLAIIDTLTPGDLTGGKQVAVTGAISGDGTVQEVGGVEQKAITARTSGVDLMLVPKGEVKAARQGAGDLRVVGVSTIDDALTALQEAGGMRVPPPTTAPARS